MSLFLLYRQLVKACLKDGYVVMQYMDFTGDHISSKSGLQLLSVTPMPHDLMDLSR
jgi:hypothetical protein